jgi:hypothetical protein
VREEYDNIIKETRNMIRHMDTEQRFEKAKAHILDALRNRPPRPMSHSPLLTPAYHLLHFLQSAVVWEWTLFLLSYLYVYLAVLDSDHYVLKLTLESLLLALFLLDTFIDYFLKSFDQFRKKNKYPAFFFWKTLLMVLMAADLVVFAALPCPDSRPIRPFRLLRACTPRPTQSCRSASTPRSGSRCWRWRRPTSRSWCSSSTTRSSSWGSRSWGRRR